MNQLFIRFCKFFSLILYKVDGNSMHPYLHHGDIVFISRSYNRKYIKNDIVVVETEFSDKLIKFIKKQKNGFVKIGSDSNLSIDSDQLGWIDQKFIIGKVVMRLSKSKFLNLPFISSV